MLTRRSFLKAGALGAVASIGLTSYAFAIEPRFRLDVTRYRLKPPGFAGAAARPLRVAIVTDIHACDPWMPIERIEEIVDVTNGLAPDITVLLGDFMAGMLHFRTAIVQADDWGRALGHLRAPLGVHAILGNHDWWTDVDAVRRALSANDIPLYENDVMRLTRDDGFSFWLAGLGDQLAHFEWRHKFHGEDDLPGTLAKIPEGGEPIILLAHEPDIFPEVPERVALTLAGHTHGGQVNLPFIGRPVVPSRFGDRYAYGHVEEGGRNLLVSAGLGCSRFPIRFGVPPEIVLAEIG
jgi:predicted MPP superfamily phosphohydrolase